MSSKAELIGKIKNNIQGNNMCIKDCIHNMQNTIDVEVLAAIRSDLRIYNAVQADMLELLDIALKLE